MRVLLEDQLNFPGASPVLHISLPLPRREHVVVMFGIYEPRQSILLREALDEARAMLPRAPGEVVCDANI